MFACMSTSTFPLPISPSLSLSARCATSGSASSPRTSRLLRRRTVARTRGFAQSCTTKSSARRSSGPPKNGRNRRVSSRTPSGARPTSSATFVPACANTPRTKWECSREVERSARKSESNGLRSAAAAAGVAAEVLASAASGAAWVDVDADGSQGTRTSCALAARTCSPTLVASASNGTIDRAADTASPFSSENVRNMASKGSVCSKASVADDFITSEGRSASSMRRSAPKCVGSSSSVLDPWLEEDLSVWGWVGGGWRSCVIAITLGRCSILSRTTVNRRFQTPSSSCLVLGQRSLVPLSLSLGSRTFANDGPVAVARVRR
jgi:hypothetical protein